MWNHKNAGKWTKHSLFILFLFFFFIFFLYIIMCTEEKLYSNINIQKLYFDHSVVLCVCVAFHNIFTYSKFINIILMIALKTMETNRKFSKNKNKKLNLTQFYVVQFRIIFPVCVCVMCRHVNPMCVCVHVGVHE